MADWQLLDAGWRRLNGVLGALASVCGGCAAAVLDEGNALWCVGVAPTPARPMTPMRGYSAWAPAADRFYRAEIAPRATAMRRGARLDVHVVEGSDRYAALSFASIYVVVVWFEKGFDPEVVRARMRRALPEIEALTLALPPPTDPGADEGAVKKRRA
jgi:hypothetical protein